MKNKIVSIVLVAVLISAGLFLLGDSALMEASATAARAPEEEWNKTFGCSDYDSASLVQQTSDGGFIIAGSTGSYGAGDVGAWQLIGRDAWLIKTDSNGNEVWNKTFGSSCCADDAYSVQQTLYGGFIIAGQAHLFDQGTFDVWLIKTDSNGNEVWAKTFGGSDYDSAYSPYSVQQTSDGGYIVASTTYSYGAGESDAWLIKTDSNGNEVWAKTFGGSDYDEAYLVQQTSDGGYIVAGSTCSYGAGESDAWLIKTDSNGNEVWAKTFGGSDSDDVYSVQQTSDGGYIVAGSTCSYGAEWVERDMWLIKTDSSGNEEWTKTFGGSDYDGGVAVSVQRTSDGGYIFTGLIGSEETDDTDIWVVKDRF